MITHIHTKIGQKSLNEMRSLKFFNKKHLKGRKLFENNENLIYSHLPEGHISDVFESLYSVANSIHKSDYDIQTMDRIVKEIERNYIDVHKDIISRSQEIARTLKNQLEDF